MKTQITQRLKDSIRGFIDAVMLYFGYTPTSEYNKAISELTEFKNKIAHYQKQPEPKKLDFELLRYVYELDYIDRMRIQYPEYAEDIKRKCIETLMKQAEHYIEFYKMPPGNRYEANIYVAKRNFHK